MQRSLSHPGGLVKILSATLTPRRLLALLSPGPALAEPVTDGRSLLNGLLLNEDTAQGFPSHG
jgi:hypothetical protein